MDTSANSCLEVAIIGMGPRGLSVLERLVARLGELQQQGVHRRVRIHTVEAGEQGAGRIWRTDQPQWLIMNTAAVEVSLYSGGPDSGPWRAGAGPSLHEWLQARAADAGDTETPSPNTYAPRRVYGQYLRDVFRNITAHLPAGVEVHAVEGRARTLRRGPDGRYLLAVSADREVVVDKAVIATGHPRTRAGDSDRELLDFASRHPRTRYLRGDSAADMDLEGIEAGEPVAILGLGLTFYDVVALLTVGRGGKYVTGSDGTLRYIPSGAEPKLVGGSRSGLPLLGRGRNQKGPDYHYEPRFFTHEAVAQARQASLAATGSAQLHFRDQVLPLILREVEHVYYRTHIRRRRGEEAAQQFTECFSATTDPAVLAKLLSDSGLADTPPLALETMARPFRGERFEDPQDFHGRLLGLLREDAAAADEGNLDGPLKASLDIMRDTRAVVRDAVEFSGLHPDSHQGDFLQWFNPINTMLSAGPPVVRIRQTIALIEAGVLTVVGPQVRIGTDEDAGRFTLQSPLVGGSRSSSRILVDARIPSPSMQIDASPLMRQLIDDRLATAHVNINAQDGSRFTTGALAVTAPPYRLVDAAGRPSRDLYALGIPTEELRWFTQIGNGRPGTITNFHSDADAIAQAVLTAVARQAANSGTPPLGSAAPSTPAVA